MQLALAMLFLLGGATPRPEDSWINFNTWSFWESMKLKQGNISSGVNDYVTARRVLDRMIS